MAKLQDLIAKCEESEINMQNLDENITEIRASKENGYVTFLTDPKIVLDRMNNRKSQKIGIVIWLPSDVFER